MARSIGDILPGILDRCAEMMGVQFILSRLADDAERKAFLMDCRDHGLLSDDEAGLLITAHMLEDA